MPSKSSTTLPLLLLTREQAALRLDVAPVFVDAIVRSGLLTPLRIRTILKFKASEVDELASQDRGWIDSVDQEPLADSGTGLLTIGMLARMFDVDDDEARAMLYPTFGAGFIRPADVWALIVAGLESQGGVLSTMEQRLDGLRSHPQRSLSRKLKPIIAQRDQWRCRYCSVEISGRAMELDHVVPRAKGGAHGADNLVLCCHPCNTSKNDRLPHEAGMRLLAIGEITDWRPSVKARKPIDAPMMAYSDLVLTILSPGLSCPLSRPGQYR